LTVIDEISVDKKLLSEAIEKWIKGLSLPIVQREFVWEPDKIKELVDSIIRDYPIGTIILWETEEDFPGSPLIDSKESESPIRIKTYIIDGQQRLTALLLIREGWKIKREGVEISSEPVSYNPSNKRLYVSEKIGIDISLLVNAALGDAEVYQKLKKTHPIDSKKAVDDIGKKIVGYPLSIYTLKTKHKLSPKELEEAANEIADIFTRINRSGEPLGNLQLFLSFFAAAFKDLKKDLVGNYRSLNNKYNKEFPRWEVINRFVFSNLGMSQNQITRVDSFKKAINELKNEYSKKTAKLHDIMNASYTAADVTLSIINSELGIYTANRIPSQNAMLPLFKWVYKNGAETAEKIPGKTKREMMGWFLVASFNGLYGNSINKRIQNDLRTVEESGVKCFPLKPLLQNMKREDIPSYIRRTDLYDYQINVFLFPAYAMLMNVLLFRKHALNWASQEVTSKPENAIHHIFPSEFLKENGYKENGMINNFNNVTIISSRINGEIGDTPPSEYLSSYDEQTLRNHMIPLDKKLWQIENYEDFLQERKRLIYDETKKLIESFSSKFK